MNNEQTQQLIHFIFTIAYYKQTEKRESHLDANLKHLPPLWYLHFSTMEIKYCSEMETVLLFYHVKLLSGSFHLMFWVIISLYDEPLTNQSVLLLLLTFFLNIMMKTFSPTSCSAVLSK